MAARGGVWFELGDQELHVGVEVDFRPAKKAHVALKVTSEAALAELAGRLRAAGTAVREDDEMEDVARFFADDPWGNRLEFTAPREAAPRAEPARGEGGVEARVRASFARQAIMDTLGARLLRVAPGEVDVELPFREDLTQQHGFLHAGVVTTLVDSACGYAALSKMPEGAAVLSVECKVNLLSPAKGERFVARARVIKAGRNVTVTAGDVFAVTGAEERIVATMLATMMTVRDRPGLRD